MYEELHYVDKFPKKFTEFKRKYAKLIKDKSYYVQFSNHKGDLLDKTAYDSPNHSDPVGNYAYPLAYVLNYPSDLWYGQNTENIRILQKNNRCKTLYLSLINTEEDCYRQMQSVLNYTYYESQEAFVLTKKYFPERLGKRNSGYWGRMFFQNLQVDIFSSDFGEYEILSGTDQSNILLKAGYDAIEDESRKDTTAVINSREPEQICFLNRKGFDVIEVIKMKHNVKTTHNSFSPEQTTISRKLAVAIFAYMDDKLIAKDSKPSSHATFYSLAGRSVNIGFEKDQSYYNDKKVGQKFHKAYKTVDENFINIYIKTEKGNIIFKSQSNDKISEVIQDISDRWDSIKDNVDIENWIPRSEKIVAAEKEAASNAKYLEQRAKIKEQNYKDLPKWISIYNKWVSHLDLDFTFVNDDAAFVLYTEIFIPTMNIASINKKRAIGYLQKDGGYLYILSKTEISNVGGDQVDKFITSYIQILETIFKMSHATNYEFWNLK